MQESAAILADTADAKVLLTVLAQVKAGDFTARMPLEWTGVAGKVADGLNDVIIANQILEGELARVSEVVGKQGKLSQRLVLGGAAQSWSGGGWWVSWVATGTRWAATGSAPTPPIRSGDKAVDRLRSSPRWCAGGREAGDGADYALHLDGGTDQVVGPGARRGSAAARARSPSAIDPRTKVTVDFRA